MIKKSASTRSRSRFFTLAGLPLTAVLGKHNMVKCGLQFIVPLITQWARVCTRIVFWLIFPSPNNCQWVYLVFVDFLRRSTVSLFKT